MPLLAVDMEDPPLLAVDIEDPPLLVVDMLLMIDAVPDVLDVLLPGLVLAASETSIN